MSQRRHIDYLVGSQLHSDWVDEGEIEVLNELEGSNDWWRAAHLGGNVATIGPSLLKLARKGLVDQRDISLGVGLRATYVYRANEIGNALLAAARHEGWSWRGFKGEAKEKEA